MAAAVNAAKERGKAVYLKGANVANPAALQLLVDTAISEYGRLDCLSIMRELCTPLPALQQG